MLLLKNFLKRLHSAKTVYGKRKFIQDFYQNEVYKRNYSKTNKSKIYYELLIFFIDKKNK